MLASQINRWVKLKVLYSEKLLSLSWGIYIVEIVSPFSFLVVMKLFLQQQLTTPLQLEELTILDPKIAFEKHTCHYWCAVAGTEHQWSYIQYVINALLLISSILSFPHLIVNFDKWLYSSNFSVFLILIGMKNRSKLLVLRRYHDSMTSTLHNKLSFLE